MATYPLSVLTQTAGANVFSPGVVTFYPGLNTFAIFSTSTPVAAGPISITVTPAAALTVGMAVRSSSAAAPSAYVLDPAGLSTVTVYGQPFLQTVVGGGAVSPVWFHAGGVVHFVIVSSTGLGSASFSAVTHPAIIPPTPGPPTIVKLIPASGPDTGGTLVDIIGADLTGATVDFDGTAGTGLVVDPSGGLAPASC